jgi:hypothetical protein
MVNSTLDWLLGSGEPWTRYRTLIDILDQPEDDPDVRQARQAMLAHPQVNELISHANRRLELPIKRHNDASHPIYSMATLADFGLRLGDPGMDGIIRSITGHQSADGGYLSTVLIPKPFGGSGEPQLSWVLCDAPTLLYSVLLFSRPDYSAFKTGLNQLTGLVQENGWRCSASPDLGKFRGPGRREDPCPIANVYALKALAIAPEYSDTAATRIGTETLLYHWEIQKVRKFYLFGIGTDFRKIKYPFVWYDILHVVDVLSRYPFLYHDARFLDMVETLVHLSEDCERYTAAAMYRAWKGWSFADKRNPSPWLTFLVHRIKKRVNLL